MTVAEIMEAVKELKVMELSELVKALEEEFGVSATPVAVAGGAAAGDGAAAAEAKTDFDVVPGKGEKHFEQKSETVPETVRLQAVGARKCDGVPFA